MALIPSQTQGFGAACTSQPVVWKRTKKVVSYCSFGNTRRCIPFKRHHQLSIVRSTAVGPVLRVNYRCLKTLSFQEVTKKNNSNGREGKKLWSLPMYLSRAWQGMEGAEKSSPQSAQGSSWFTKLQEQNIIQLAKEILQKPQSRLKFPDKDQMIKQLQEAQLDHTILGVWKSLDVSIQWPLAIFFSCYLAITVLYGFRASNDLLPLWTIGPLMMVIYIKLCQIVYAHCIRIATNVVIMGKTTFIAAKNGDLTRPMLLQFEQFLEGKRSELVYYFKGGGFKKFLEQKRREYEEQISEAIQDYAEDNWPRWRAITGFLRKIFPE